MRINIGLCLIIIALLWQTMVVYFTNDGSWWAIILLIAGLYNINNYGEVKKKDKEKER